MRHGSLFSGIGGFDLAAEWMGWTNVFHCEWNEFGQKVLKHYWPDAISYTDITKTDFTKHYGAIDIISGGFPCQPYSTAGKRLGKEDERHLWPEMLRAIREVSPRYVVGENVRGLTNWNGGVVFDEVQADLEAEGYEVLPFLLPACGVGAPHRRDRIWFIAYAEGIRRQRRASGRGEEWQGVKGKQSWNYALRSEFGGHTVDVADAHGKGLEGRRIRSGNDAAGWQNEGRCAVKSTRNAWATWPTVAPLCNGNDGLSTGMDLNAISFSKWRAESIKAGGNAVVPQIPFELFKAIEAYENLQASNL